MKITEQKIIELLKNNIINIYDIEKPNKLAVMVSLENNYSHDVAKNFIHMLDEGELVSVIDKFSKKAYNYYNSPANKQLEILNSVPNEKLSENVINSIFINSKSFLDVAGLEKVLMQKTGRGLSEGNYEKIIDQVFKQTIRLSDVIKKSWGGTKVIDSIFSDLVERESFQNAFHKSIQKYLSENKHSLYLSENLVEFVKLFKPTEEIGILLGDLEFCYKNKLNDAAKTIVKNKKWKNHNFTHKHTREEFLNLCKIFKKNGSILEKSPFLIKKFPTDMQLKLIQSAARSCGRVIKNYTNLPKDVINTALKQDGYAIAYIGENEDGQFSTLESGKKPNKYKKPDIEQILIAVKTTPALFNQYKNSNNIEKNVLRNMAILAACSGNKKAVDYIDDLTKEEVDLIKKSCGRIRYYVENKYREHVEKTTKIVRI